MVIGTYWLVCFVHWTLKQPVELILLDVGRDDEQGLWAQLSSQVEFELSVRYAAFKSSCFECFSKSSFISNYLSLNRLSCYCD